VSFGVREVVLLKIQFFRYFIFILHCFRVLLTMKCSNKGKVTVRKFLSNSKRNALKEYAKIKKKIEITMMV
jgi:hypothetical protein